MAKVQSPLPFLDFAALHRATADDLHQQLDRTLASGWLIGGPLLEEFETAFARYADVKHCLGVANGLDALRLGLLAAGIGPGDEVLVPSNTYIATWLAVSQVGATPVPVEPDPATFNLDPHLLHASLTNRTRAIIPVHLYGRCADADPIQAFARQHGLFTLEDAAQAFGASYRGRPAGGLGDAAAWSFYPGKNLGALGDAGAITTNDDALADRVRLLRNYGSRTKYVHLIKGWNSRLDPLQAAFLLGRLERAPAWTSRRQAIATRYQTELGSLPGIVVPSAPDDGIHGWHLFVLRVSDRTSLTKHLDERGIGWLIHYPITPASSEAYRDMPGLAHSNPIAEQLASEVLSLPLHPFLSDDDQTRVIRALTDWAERRPS